MKNIIPYGQHFIDEEDIEAVVDVLRHKNLTQGDEVYQFEKSICNYVGCNYAVAVSSGSAALHIASIAANIKKI